jgi:hypothetical protein
MTSSTHWSATCFLTLVLPRSRISPRPMCFPCCDLDAIAQRRDERHSDEILLAELSKLNALDYRKRRKAAAKKFGITTATLDKIVAERRVRRSAQMGPETLLPHWDV